MKNIMPAAAAAAMFAAVTLVSMNAKAATPVAVWDGDFSSLTSGSGTLSLNGNTLTNDNSTILIGSSLGVLVDFSTALSEMTVLVKYSDLSLTTQGTLATSYAYSVNNRTGVYLTSAGATYGIWCDASWSSGGTGSSVTTNEGAYAFAYSATGGTYFYQVADGTATALYSKTGLKSSSDASNINGCAVGGERGSSSLGAATGMKITGIAVFSSVLSADDIAGYTWPSDVEAVTATLSDTTATWSTKAGMTLDAESWTDSSSTALKVVNDLTEDATFTFDSDITASQLIVSGSGNTTFATNSSATVTIPAYDFSQATGRTTLGYDWGTATVQAGADTVVDTANLGTGDITVGSGYKLTYSGTTALTSFPFASDAENGTIIVDCPVELDSSDTDGFNPLGGSRAVYRFGSNTTFTAYKMTLGNGDSGTQNIYQDGGEITLTNSNSISTSSPLVVGHWPITAYFYSYGGTLTAQNAVSVLGWNGYSYWYIGDGSSDNDTAQVDLLGLVIGRSDASANGRAKQLHLQTGGTLTVGSSGITVPYDHSNTVVTMAGGTLACSADASITLGTNNTSTADTTTYLTAASGTTMTIESALNGAGSFAIDGAGTVVIAETPTTTGSFSVAEGSTIQFGAEVVIDSSNITLASGSTLQIVATAEDINNGYDASAYTNNGATVEFYDESGTKLTENVNGAVLSGAANYWATLESGSWDATTGWSSGSVPTSTARAALSYTNAVITVTEDSVAYGVYVQASATISGTSDALAAFAGNISELKISDGATLTLACTDDGTYTFAQAITGDGALVISGGTVILTGANTYAGGTTVSSGLLIRGSATAFGASGTTVTVSDGATVDLGGDISSSNTYTFDIAGAGSTGREYAMTGASNTTMTVTGIAGISLSANATVYAMTFGDSVNGNCNVELNGYTLKTTGTVLGCNVKFYGEGVVDVASGTYTAEKWNNQGTNATLQVDSGATYASSLWNGTDRCKFLNVVNNGTVSMNGSYLLYVDGGTCSGSGTFNNLYLTSGTTLDLAAGLDVTNALSLADSAVIKLPAHATDCVVKTSLGGTVTCAGAITVDASAITEGTYGKVVLTASNGTFPTASTTFTNVPDRWATSVTSTEILLKDPPPFVIRLR